MNRPRLGLLFDEETTDKLNEISVYMNKEPYPLLADAIEKMWLLYMDVIENAR